MTSTATTERSVVEVLRAAKERVLPEKQWTRGMFARDVAGKECEPTSAFACRWCAQGAVYAEVGTAPGRARPALSLLADASRYPTPYVNDHQGHDAVLDLFDRAIELAEEAEQK
jgi:hypothetical protein